MVFFHSRTLYECCISNSFHGFATVLNLSTHHIEKLNPGGQVFYEKLKQEIISKLDAKGFPPHLNLQDQGRFFVGYYHQRQDLFMNKENKEME